MTRSNFDTEPTAWPAVAFAVALLTMATAGTVALVLAVLEYLGCGT